MDGESKMVGNSPMDTSIPVLSSKCYKHSCTYANSKLQISKVIFGSGPNLSMYDRYDCIESMPAHNVGITLGNFCDPESLTAQRTRYGLRHGVLHHMLQPADTGTCGAHARRATTVIRKMSRPV